MDILPAIVLKETPIEMDEIFTKKEVKEITVIVEDTKMNLLGKMSLDASIAASVGTWRRTAKIVLTKQFSTKAVMLYLSFGEPHSS